MRHALRRLLVAVPAAALIGLSAALAQTGGDSPPASVETAKVAQDVITQQIEAFKRDDGTAAYAFAAPEIQAMYPNVDVFMRMVQTGYTPVYRPQVYSFSEAQDAGAGIVRQFVDITTADGELWIAEYMLRPQPDGSLKIAGCSLKKKPGTGV